MIDKEDFDKLFDENLTIKEQARIIELIDERADYICRKYLLVKNTDTWWDYDNGSKEVDGQFDAELYREYIDIDCSQLKPWTASCNSFPTKWLWESDEEIEAEIKSLSDEEQDKKEKAKQKRIDKKKQLDLLKKSISSKLTKEELKVIKFK